eukprot:scaffold20027_cov138-Isochrysis_galbana.AAC.1
MTVLSFGQTASMVRSPFQACCVMHDSTRASNMGAQRGVHGGLEKVSRLCPVLPFAREKARQL